MLVLDQQFQDLIPVKKIRIQTGIGDQWTDRTLEDFKTLFVGDSTTAVLQLVYRNK